MRKLQLLHSYLIETGLVTPEQLNTTATFGKIIFLRIGAPYADIVFKREYTAQIMVNHYGGNPDNLDAAIVWWCALYQSDIGGDNNGYGFEADIIDSETVNLNIIIPLTESVNFNMTTKKITNCAKPLVLEGDERFFIPVFFDRVMQEVIETQNG